METQTAIQFVGEPRKGESGVQFCKVSEDNNEVLRVSRDSFIERIQRIRNSQREYETLFSKLSTVVGQLREKYPVLEDHNDDETDSNGTSPSSGASTSSEVQSSSSNEVLPSYRNKRKFNELEEPSDFIETDTDELQNEEYPKRIDCERPIVIIGPNGTQLEASAFESISWSATASATRSLLSLVFSSDVLATHTLTGKPSPAFYGRERPLKMQLDPLKTADIVHCVRVKCGANEREVRSSITTKCADTAKKYKRRMGKKVNRA